MGVSSNIQKIFDTRLKALPGNPYISWPNTQFKPGPTSNYTTYLRPMLYMANEDLYTLNNQKKIPGFYQVDILGQLNRGVQTVNTLADEVKSWFESERELDEGNTKIFIKDISYGPSSVQDGWWVTFVQINFHSFNS